MNLVKIAWRSIQQRALASSLTCFSMALGVMLVVSVLAVFGVVTQSFQNNSSLGYGIIVGPKGGKLQLTLNTVFYLSAPVENIPYDFYMEFLPAAKRDEELATAIRPANLEPGRAGRYSAFVSTVIPVCLGDYFGNFRVVGTTPDFFGKLKYGPSADKPYEFTEGRNFLAHSPDNGFFEAVVGATVAREKKVKVGDEIHATHGDPNGEGHGQGFRVVGIVKRTGTPNDRAVFVNMEGFYLMEDHAKPLEEESNPSPATEGSTTDNQKTTPLENLQPLERKPLPLEQREVTALLVRTVNPLVTPSLKNSINEGPVGMVVLPIEEIYNLFELFVKPIQWALLIVTALICVVSGVSILVSIYNSMSERRHEIAVMRALGADRWTVTWVILLESVILALAAGVFGWLAGHTLNGLAGPEIEARTGVSIGFFDVAPGINLISLVGSEPEPESIIRKLTTVSIEFVLVPLLVVLAIVAGLMPAILAYRTDVAKSLGV